MAEEDYEQKFNRYFETQFEQRTLQGVLEVLEYSLNTVKTNLDDNDLFEGVNLSLQGAVELPVSNSAHEYLEDVREELLGWEDVEAVLKDADKVQTAKRDWCGYIEEVISKVTKQT